MTFDFDGWKAKGEHMKAEGAASGTAGFDDMVAVEADKIRARREATRIVDEEEAGPPPPPDQSRLDLKALVDPNRPPRKWFWQGLIPEGDHVSIIAPGGTGKSLLALSLAVMAVRGAACFIGRELSLPGDRKVFYIDMENSEDDWAERLVDLGVTQDEVEQWGDRFIALGMPALRGLDTEHGAKQLLEMVEHFGVTMGDLMVLDSTQRLTEGEENSSDVIRRMYTLISAELKRRGITVIRTDNTGKVASKGARGTSAKSDDIGYSLVLECDEKDDSVFTLSSGKHRSKVTVDDNRLIFRKSNDPVTGRLLFEPTKSTYPAKLAEVSALLAQLGVPAGAGQNAAWKAWKSGIADKKVTPPTWHVTQKVVFAAQRAREPVGDPMAFTPP